MVGQLLYLQFTHQKSNQNKIYGSSFTPFQPPLLDSSLWPHPCDAYGLPIANIVTLSLGWGTSVETLGLILHSPVLAMEIFDVSYSILSYGFSFGLVSWSVALCWASWVRWNMVFSSRTRKKKHGSCRLEWIVELKLEVRVILQKKKLTVNNANSTLGWRCKVSHTTRFYIAVSGNVTVPYIRPYRFVLADT